MLGPKARSSSCPCNPGRPQAASGVGLPAEVDSDGPSAPREGQPGLRGSRGGGAAPLGSMTSRNGQGMAQEQNPANNRLSGARTPRGALWSGPDCEVLAREPTKPNSREPVVAWGCPSRRRLSAGPVQDGRSASGLGAGLVRVLGRNAGPSGLPGSPCPHLEEGRRLGAPRAGPRIQWVSRRVRLWDPHTGGATPRPPPPERDSGLLLCTVDLLNLPADPTRVQLLAPLYQCGR